MKTPMTRPGPNELLPCGTSGARRRHLAHGRACAVCWPSGGLPAIPDSTAAAVPGWLDALIAAEFGSDVVAVGVGLFGDGVNRHEGEAPTYLIRRFAQ